MAELKAVINLEDNFSSQIKAAIDNTDIFKQAVSGAKNEVNALSNQKFTATITAKDDEFKQVVSNAKGEADNLVNQSFTANITAKDDEFKEAVSNARSEADTLSNQNFTTALTAKDEVTEKISQIRASMEGFHSGNFAATIMAKDEATEQISKTKKALSDIKKSVLTTIGAKDEASSHISTIRKNAEDLVKKNYRLEINAIDKTKSIIKGITDSIFNLKTLAAGIILGGTAKKGFDWTIGNAMDNEDFSATLETVLHSKEKGSDALKWAYKDAASTPFDAKQVVSGVTQLSTSGLDYTKYLNPLGDAAAAMNKPLEQAIFAMGKLKSGQLGMAVDMFRDFGISNQDWTAHGATFAKNGEMTGVTPDQAVDMVTKIINEKYGGLMERKSGAASGMLSNIGDNIAAMGRGLSGIDDNGQMMENGLFDNFKKQLVNIGPILDGLKGSDAFTKLQTDIGNLATVGGEKLTSFLEGFKDPEVVQKYEDTFSSFIDGLKEGAKTAIAFGKAVFTVGRELKPLFDLIIAHPNIFLGLFAGFEAGKGTFTVMQIFKDVRKELPGTIEAVKSFGSGFGGVFKSIGPVFGSISKNIFNFAKSIPSGLNTVVGTVRLWTGAIGTVLKNNFVKVLSSSGKGILNFAKSIPEGLISIITSVKNVVSTIGGFLKNNLLKVVSSVARGIMTIIKPLFSFLSANPVILIIMAIIAVVALLYEAWKHDWGGIQEKTHAVIDFVKQKIESIKETFAHVKESIAKFAENIGKKWEEIKKFFEHPIDGTVNIVKNWINGKDDSGKEPGKNALGTSFWKGGLTWVGEKGPELIDLQKGAKVYDNRTSMNMVNGIDNNPDIVNSLPTNFSKAGEDIPTSLSKGIKKTSDVAADSITKMSEDVLKTFGTGITDNSKYATKATDEVSTSIQDVFGTLAKQSNPLGKNVSDGLKEGMQSSTSDVTEMAKTLTDKVIETFKTGFDIHSPSRILHIIGGHVMQGFINGMGSKDVKAFADKHVKSVIGAFGSAVNLPGGVSDWLTKALMATGTPLNWLPGLQKLVMAESGGDPNEVNNQSVGGEYATGLLQTLPSTFKEYMQKGMNNILNPVDNASAAINYIKSRYGDVYNTPLFKGGSYVGYATGTEFATPGYHWVGEKGPELMKFNGGEKVINHKDSQKAIGGNKFYIKVNIEGNAIGNEELFDQCGEHIADKILTVLETNV